MKAQATEFGKAACGRGAEEGSGAAVSQVASEGPLPIATAPVDDPPSPAPRAHTYARSLTHTPAALRHRLTSRSARPAPSLPPAGPACALRWDHVGGGGGGRGSGSVSGRARSERAAELRGASQYPQRLLLPLLLASFTLPAVARRFTPGARRAAPAAAPLLPPRVRAGVPDRAGALAGSRLPAAAAATGSGSGRTNRAAVVAEPGPPPPLQPRSRHPHARDPALPQPAPGRAQSPGSAAARRERPTSVGRPRPWDSEARRPPTGQLSLVQTRLLSPPSLGRRVKRGQRQEWAARSLAAVASLMPPPGIRTQLSTLASGTSSRPSEAPPPPLSRPAPPARARPLTRRAPTRSPTAPLLAVRAP